jgi:hypothetical protein
MDDRVVGAGLLDLAREPLLFDQTPNCLELVWFDRSIVEVGRVAGDTRLPILA